MLKNLIFILLLFLGNVCHGGFFPSSLLISKNSSFKFNNIKKIDVKRVEIKKKKKLEYIKKIYSVLASNSVSMPYKNYNLFIYWKIGEELNNKNEDFIFDCSKTLQIDADIIYQSINFYKFYQSISPILNWNMYLNLLKINDLNERQFYYYTAIKNNLDENSLLKLINDNVYSTNKSDLKNILSNDEFSLINPEDVVNKYLNFN